MSAACATEQTNSLRAQLLIRTDIGEDLLAAAFLRFKSEGLLPIIYHDGIPTLSEFLLWNQRTDVITAGGFVRPILDNGTPDPERLELAGLIWLSAVKRLPSHARADIGYCCFRQYQHDDIPFEFGNLFFDFAFDKAGMDVLYGSTPVANRPARIFIEKIGFKKLCEAPMFCNWNGIPCACIISYLTKKDWRQLSRGKV